MTMDKPETCTELDAVKAAAWDDRVKFRKELDAVIAENGRLREALKLLHAVVTDANREHGMSWGLHFGRLMTALGKASDELRSIKITGELIENIEQLPMK